MASLGYTVNTEFSDEMIIQTTSMINGMGVMEEISREVIKMKECGIEEALVKMGWTPPEGHRLREE